MGNIAAFCCGAAGTETVQSYEAAIKNGQAPTKTYKKSDRKMQDHQADLFMEKWDAYKNIANNAIGAKARRNVSADASTDYLKQFDVNGDGIIGHSEYEAMEASIGQLWKERVDAGLAERAKKAGKTVQALKQEFIEHHITGIEDKGYKLSGEAKECLNHVLERFFICDVGPAPFSIHTAEEIQANLSVDECAVTVSQHCLQMAMHWLRNPPEFLNVLELSELVVLSLFHDVYYYDDFTNHAALTVKMMEKFCEHDVPKAVVGGHIHLKPNEKELQTMHFSSPLEALKQEWVQMDWYLTLVNVKQDATRSKRVGDGVVANLDFFHHHLGHFFTKGQQTVIQTADAQKKNW